MEIIFERPGYLFLLLAIPVMILFHIISLKFIRKRSIKFANFEAIKRIRGVEIFSKNLTVLYINIIVMILIVFAVAGTKIVTLSEVNKMSFVLALDSSRSMGAQDIPPNRLEAAKEAAENFINIIPEKTRVGIISFSGTSFIEQDMTDDKAVLKNAIKNIDLKLIGGTDILGAITVSSNLLKNENAKTIILLSDGQANVNELQEIIDYVEKNKVIVHTLAIGTRKGGKDEKGGFFRVAEDTLKIIAEKSGGKYYNIKKIEDFYNSFKEIKKLKKKKEIHDVSFYLTFVALVLFIFNFILINTKYRTLP